ncbi:hypothetical protein OAH22_01800 [bacterium]|nr:hypothetical protein [bacterium]
MNHRISAFTVPLVAAFVLLLAASPTLHAQGRYEVTTGFWIPILPSYELADALDQTRDQRLSEPAALGGQIGFQGIYHFQPTRTMLEFDLNFAYADGVTSDSTSKLATTETVDGDIFHHSQYIGLRDQFDLTGWRLGILDIGCGLSHLRYDQNLTTRTNPASFMVDESIDNDYLGGEIRSSITQMIHNRPITLDFNVGIFDLDGRTQSSLAFDYGSATGILPIGVASPSFDTTAFTIDLGVRWQTSICGLTTTPSVSFKYISDMATITHSEILSTSGYTNVGVRSEEAYFLSLNLEFLL